MIFQAALQGPFQTVSQQTPSIEHRCKEPPQNPYKYFLPFSRI